MNVFVLFLLILWLYSWELRQTFIKLIGTFFRWYFSCELEQLSGCRKAFISYPLTPKQELVKYSLQLRSGPPSSVHGGASAPQFMPVCHFLCYICSKASIWWAGLDLVASNKLLFQGCLCTFCTTGQHAAGCSGTSGAVHVRRTSEWHWGASRSTTGIQHAFCFMDL